MSNVHVNEHQAHSLGVAIPDATDSEQGAEHFTTEQPETSPKISNAAYDSNTAADPARIVHETSQSRNQINHKEPAPTADAMVRKCCCCIDVKSHTNCKCSHTSITV